MKVSSNYHIEVNHSDAGIHDRITQTLQVDPGGQREFKTIVLSEVDQLTKDAQHVLRRTMEKYVATCRFLCVNSTSRVIPANSICKKEGIDIPPELATRITQKSDYNLRRAILMLEACKVQQYPFTVGQDLPEIDWQVFFRKMANQIVQEQSPQKLETNCDMSLKTQTLNFVQAPDAAGQQAHLPPGGVCGAVYGAVQEVFEPGFGDGTMTGLTVETTTMPFQL
ncbi:replication factor C subunit 3 [Culex quinquefasciatus]|uniref:Replication factor C subunit 3 n=1 Tax=Culex quinquefasciatus TaxID=7176 RepID=B0X554_CULQU|nr:replication factor C subunit 3 [Culex quinquefasciatus]|eukprot:XP_001864776.1 replication factor C subunit 3 [Culex quinquefasciatus]